MLPSLEQGRVAPTNHYDEADKDIAEEDSLKLIFNINAILEAQNYNLLGPIENHKSFVGILKPKNKQDTGKKLLGIQ